MIPIELDSVLLDTLVSNDLANILTENETTSINMSIDDKWTLIIDIHRPNDESTKRMLVANELWEATYSA